MPNRTMVGQFVQQLPAFSPPVAPARVRPNAGAVSAKAPGQKRLTRRTIVPTRDDLAKRIIEKLEERYPAPLKLYDCVAADTGISVDTLKKLFSRRSTPSLPAFWRLCMAYGPTFLADVFEMDWLQIPKQAKRAEELLAQLDDLQSEISKLRN